jgi:hypothetical protein
MEQKPAHLNPAGPLNAPAGDLPSLDTSLSTAPLPEFDEVSLCIEEYRSRCRQKLGQAAPTDDAIEKSIRQIATEVSDSLVVLKDRIIPELGETDLKMYRRMYRIIEGAGGAIDDLIFVTRPGVMAVTETPVLTPQAQKLFADMALDVEEPAYAQMVHFKTALTNLTFPETGKDTAGFIDKVVGKAAHRSVTNDIKPVFLVAGVALETSLELIAHHEGDVGRLTSSATNAMNFPLYEISGTPLERLMQKREILAHVLRENSADAALNRRLLSDDGKEYVNRLHPACKVTALTYSMGLKDYHKLFIGRFAPIGNEKGIQDVCLRMCEHLHAAYPLIIAEPDWYRKQNNAKKYES